MTAMSDVTRILQAIEQGDLSSSEELIPIVYDELRRLAAVRLNQEKPGQTLTPTALVHEAFIRLTGNEPGKHWAGQAHFFGAAAEAMRRILIDNARRKQRLKHGGDVHRVELDSHIAFETPVTEDVLALDEGLAQFATEEPEAAKVVSLRYFGGLTIEQTAQAMNLSVRTVNRHWAFAKAWLYDFLNRGKSTS